ncbi:MAG: C25 family cysteine peptidase [candidate division WOR-3 bacterium]|nr:C25 family cysteine peptidase [candidate division WOR-3 bacterium]
MIAFMLSFLIAYEYTPTQQIDFTTEQLRFTVIDGYTRVRIMGCEISNDVGAPEIPTRALKIALPYGATDIGIQIIATETETLAGEYLLSCAQPPQVLSKDEPRQPVLPNQDIYTSNRLYPGQIIEFRGVGRLDNHEICELVVYPIQYKPESRKLIFNRSVRFRITYRGGTKRTAQSSLLKKMIINPEDISEYERTRDPDDITYLIISNPPFDTVFQRLADWKTKKGLPAHVRTVDWILANYTGEDNAACIRNYIKTLPDSNIQYVLLGGDTYMIPCRFAYAMTCSASIWNREDSLPCDLYYADLQGNWNFDGDGLYGEVEDSIDLYPDLSVGRAPVSSVTEAQNFVNKILTYEKNPPNEYLDKALLLAEVLWQSPFTDQAIHKNRIEEESFLPNLVVTKLYETLGNENRQSVMAAIRSGQNLINHDGHGSTSVMGVGVGYLNTIDLDTITNAPRYGIIFSLGCWTAAFDFACIAEGWMNNENGGGVAFVGNSSYGWGSPGNPGFGISDIFDSRFFYSLLVENNYHIGEALAMCKAYFIPYSREKNVYRWHQYQLNLLGEPEMMVWTALPESIAVAAPQSVALGSSSILISVRAKNTNAPIKNALVCLMKADESYAAGYTDVSGQIFLQASPATLGDFELTVTAQNYVPLETTLPVVSGPYVNYQRWILNDSLGNGDGIANPNEIILLSLLIKNTGNATANNMDFRLRSQDPYVIISDSIEYLGTLNQQDSTCLDHAFSILVGNTTNAHTLSFELEITEASRTLTHYPGILVGTPELSIPDFSVSNAPTMPGDTAQINISIANAGYGFAHTTQISLSSTDPYVTVITDSVSAGEIPPDTTCAVGPFHVAVSSSCPPGHHPQLSFNMATESYNFNQDIVLLIGETGFIDDMESGSGLWTTGGSNNQWHISTRRAFSADHAWYCGQESNGLYLNNMDCYIQTIPFMVDHNSTLNFMRWFEVPIYGSDGIYVIIVHGNGSDTLNFIGTGGALDSSRAIQGDWFKDQYPLGQYAGGDTIQLRIAFKSDYDGDVAEGFYIDDINIEAITFLEEYSSSNIYPLILDVRPNPFRYSTDIRYVVNDYRNQYASGEVDLRIFDVTGRLVKTFSGLSSHIDLHTSVNWDGHDDKGRRLAPGIYFAVLSIANDVTSEKIIIIH